MSIGSIIGAIAAPVLGKVFGDDETSGTQVTTQAPAPRTGEGQKIWDEFMDKLLGEGGLETILSEQAEYLQPKVSEYTGILSDLMTNKGIGEGLLSPTTISLGGEGGFSFVPRSNRETIGLLESLAAKRLGTEEMFAPGGEKIKYLDALKPLAMGTEALRYNIPSSTTTGTLSGQEPSLLSQITGGINIGKELEPIIANLFKKKSP